jgi:hypothetical protein
MDGRFPVYVVFSVRSRLEAVYGAQTAAALEGQMQRLVQAIRGERGWGACLLLVDDPDSASAAGIKPARPGDAWALKSALVELDSALAKRGQMVGAVLIVGGPEVVPFHLLPNPLDDPDLNVPSDNPYATRDTNYFVPEWPVGRLPGGAGVDASLLLGFLQRITVQHTARARAGRRDPWYQRWLYLLSFRPWLPLPKKLLRKSGRVNIGYTAEIWKKAAAAVFQPIGQPDTMYISPPCGVNGQEPTAKNNVIPSLEGDLGYFNLHGMADAAEWYGQRDPLSQVQGPDYPVALRPQDIHANGRGPSGMPQVVFSEACYGLHIPGKSIDQAISLKFLQAGSQAVVGSTTMAYGTVGEPLVAADLLGQTFWRFVHQGLPVGEALRQAKIYLAGSMHQRQGYLDGEDQKTLISFVLYGDPLAQPLEPRYGGKRVRRQLSHPPLLTTVCERGDCPLGECVNPNPSTASQEVLESVRQVVARYLPGMEEARVTILQPRQRCSIRGGGCLTELRDPGVMERSQVATSQAFPAPGKLPKELFSEPELDESATPPVRRLVTLSKEVFFTSQVTGETRPFPCVARLTLDEHGKLIKLVVSR